MLEVGFKKITIFNNDDYNDDGGVIRRTPSNL